jgi:hypothetical protein
MEDNDFIEKKDLYYNKPSLEEIAASKIEFFDELLNLIESQFNPEIELNIDKTDYFQVYCGKFLKMPRDTSLDDIPEYIKGDVIYDEFNTLLSVFIKYFDSYYGIIINPDTDNLYELIYNLYNTFILNPDMILINYLLYHHFYVDNHDLKSFLKDKFINDIVIKYINNNTPLEKIFELKHELSTNTIKDDIEIDEKMKLDVFIAYCKYLLSLEFFFTENLFKEMNTLFENETYKMLDDELNVHFNYHFDSDELIVNLLIKNLLDQNNRLPELTKIIEKFFDFIQDIAKTEIHAIK